MTYKCIAGLPGFAAWVGIEVLGDPKPGSNVFVSAAAGGVGMFAGQLAKLKGCRVIGSTGSDEKVCIATIKIYDKVCLEALLILNKLINNINNSIVRKV